MTALGDRQLNYFQIRNGCRVVILGAGASFGANVPLSPPTMKDFIRVGKARSLTVDYRPLWELLRHLGYSDEAVLAGQPNLEELFTELDSLSKGLGYRTGPDYFKHLVSGLAPVLPVRWLEAFIVEVLDEVSRFGIQSPCSHHEALARTLSPGDVIVSFNYDTLMDAALQRSGRWGPWMGYGFIGGAGVEEWAYTRHDVLLLKTHGSLNWTASGRPVTGLSGDVPSGALPSQPDWAFGGTPQPSADRWGVKVHPLTTSREGNVYRGYLSPREANFLDELGPAPPGMEFLQENVDHSDPPAFLVPPSAYKFGGPQSLPKAMRDVWAHVREALEKADQISVVGYSMPPTDQHFAQLLSLAVKNRRVRGGVVNPDPTVLDHFARRVPSVSWARAGSTLAEWTRAGCQ